MGNISSGLVSRHTVPMIEIPLQTPLTMIDNHPGWIFTD